jgi:hypothetical protein
LTEEDYSRMIVRVVAKDRPKAVRILANRVHEIELDAEKGGFSKET